MRPEEIGLRGALFVGIKVTDLRAAARSAFERKTVGTLLDGRIGFVSADLDRFERTVICVFAMIFTLSNTAFDAFVCLFVHENTSTNIFCAVAQNYYAPFSRSDSPKTGHDFIHRI